MYCNCTKFIHIHRGRRSTCGTYRSSVYSRSNFIVRRKVTSKWRGWYRPFRGLLNLLLYVTSSFAPSWKHMFKVSTKFERKVLWESYIVCIGDLSIYEPIFKGRKFCDFQLFPRKYLLKTAKVKTANLFNFISFDLIYKIFIQDGRFIYIYI